MLKVNVQHDDFLGNRSRLRRYSIFAPPNALIRPSICTPAHFMHSVPVPRTGPDALVDLLPAPAD